MTLIRYPGSKRKLADEIISRFPDKMKIEIWMNPSEWEYREPFFGSGSFGFQVLKHLPKQSKVWINDLDYGLYCLWRSVCERPRELTKKNKAFTPTADAFFQFKSEDGRKDIDEVEAGFRKLALHQMSVSGFGFMSGGPLGGKDQDNAKYPVNSRWNADRLQRSIATCHLTLKRFREIKISHVDFEQMTQDVSNKCFIYFDPPYVAKGHMLYQQSMSIDDHRRLARQIKNLPCDWVLSYDDHAEVRKLYGGWTNIETVLITYSTATHAEVRPKNQEIVISSF